MRISNLRFLIIVALIVKSFPPPKEPVSAIVEPVEVPKQQTAAGSAIGKAGWGKVQKQVIKLQAVHAFKAKIGMASVLRRHRRHEVILTSLDGVVGAAIKRN